ncbi:MULTISPECIES: asparagine synthetase B family protein [unclassified Brevundimonas]|jgi:asparagine synthase (glutamine-hydrolysing)|uniref:asparagine synthetase B family protein n=1 Tax=unclassified Brevundimonas TaxID=2622653 RepID=UPI000C545D20|nr:MULTISPECIES: asparagine synthetase B [unclassified Brevundimonas]MAL87797.1 asparagine synthetase B [Brevundimonas sp.]HAV49529.1 asparagine synthetase B [Brevundimonas sp.]|tara:strand:+ start:5586 stop:7520 length:1935 start_codon:yes stop_codon:yes gene_type:complete
MTALAGVWRLDGRTAAEPCRLMNHAQALYGPDGEGLWDGGDVALGLRRFDCLDEDRFDAPPLTSACGRYHLVADVRLDDREGLADTLGVDAFQAKNSSDTRLLLAAWERWQTGLFDHVYGDYAFAVWDTRDRQLTLARDALGAKPLHYHRQGGLFAFASMAKGLHALPDVPIAPNASRVTELLALLPESGPETWFQDIYRVEPGHYVLVTATGQTIHRHWNPSRTLPVPQTFEAQVEGLRQHLDRAVQSRLRGAGRRIGSHLSAGLDSSAVAATAARLMAETGGRVAAFTSSPRAGFVLPGMPGQVEDETELASATAALYPNMDHVVLRNDGRDLTAGLDRGFNAFERPVLNICNARWTDHIHEEARRLGLNVLLVGAMGNMTFSYDGKTLPGELLKKGDLVGFLRQGHALSREKRMNWKGYLAQALGPWMPTALWRFASRLRGRIAVLGDYSAVKESAVVAHDLRRRARDRGHDLEYRSEADAFAQRLRILGRVDFGNYAKGVMGGWGLDVRDPTADRRLVEYCLALPTEAFLNDGLPRRLARLGLTDRLPAVVLEERRKGYQAADWFENVQTSRASLLQEVRRLRNVDGVADVLDLDRLERLLESMPERDWTNPEAMRDYRLVVLRGVSAGHFMRKAARTNA